MISIIIPTYNEVKYLRRTVNTIYDRLTGDVDIEVIVVDGGSTDGTVDIALSLPVKLLKESNMNRDRFNLLNVGARQSCGDILFFLDADSIVPHAFDAAVVDLIEKKRFVGGAFEFTLDGKEFGLRIVEMVNRLRYRIWKRYYGDQGLFVTKEIYEKVGGFPAVMIMETSDFCLSIKRHGERLALIHQPMLTSARRFLDNGIYKVLGMDFILWGLNMLGINVDNLAKKYWSVNEISR